MHLTWQRESPALRPPLGLPRVREAGLPCRLTTHPADCYPPPSSVRSPAPLRPRPPRWPAGYGPAAGHVSLLAFPTCPPGRARGTTSCRRVGRGGEGAAPLACPAGRCAGRLTSRTTPAPGRGARHGEEGAAVAGRPCQRLAVYAVAGGLSCPNLATQLAPLLLYPSCLGSGRTAGLCAEETRSQRPPCLTTRLPEERLSHSKACVATPPAGDLHALQGDVGDPHLHEEELSWELVAAGKPPVVVLGITSG